MVAGMGRRMSQVLGMESSGALWPAGLGGACVILPCYEGPAQVLKTKQKFFRQTSYGVP